MKQFEGSARRSAKPVNGLIRVADRENIPFRAGEASENLNLREVGVLKLVGQNKAGAPSGLCQ